MSSSISPSGRGAGAGPLAVFAIAASFLVWGVLPVYWKALRQVSPFEILAHRIVWSMAFSAALVSFRRGWADLRAAASGRRVLRVFFLSASLLGINWFTYIRAVNHGDVLGTSLGYYICPLVSVALGRLVLKERMRPWQKAAVVLAALGVLNQIVFVGAVPIAAIVLAVTFGLYGLIRKTARLGSLDGLVVESGLLSAPALACILVWAAQGRGALGHADAATHLLLAGTGVITSLPLLSFAWGARRVSLSTLGFLQYLSPTCGFFLGVFAYKERFEPAHLVTFGLVWAGLIVYTVESVAWLRGLPGPRKTAAADHGARRLPQTGEG
ncbi:MAG: EamA family transporter RarD [Candidatus Sumerlaeota bacterium]|nr:EamA family transporter RarD [Candidatus Sumerlaeota bacterium]